MFTRYLFKIKHNFSSSILRPTANILDFLPRFTTILVIFSSQISQKNNNNDDRLKFISITAPRKIEAALL